MTNRSMPGKQNQYLASITFNLSSKLLELSGSNLLNSWLIQSSKVKRVAYYFKSQAYYNELESALECKKYLEGYKKFINMFFWGYKAGSLNISTFKMLVRTILMLPSIPKK